MLDPPREVGTTGKRGAFTKALAVVGMVLVWFPLLATIITSVVGSLRARVFRLDWLMPAELFPLAFAGGGLLLWASFLARSRRGLTGISWGLGLSAGLLVAIQGFAIVTGLASGATEPTRWVWIISGAAMGIYALALVKMGTTGVVLVRDLFRQRQ